MGGIFRHPRTKTSTAFLPAPFPRLLPSFRWHPATRMHITLDVTPGRKTKWNETGTTFAFHHFRSVVFIPRFPFPWRPMFSLIFYICSELWSRKPSARTISKARQAVSISHGMPVSCEISMVATPVSSSHPSLHRPHLKAD